MSDLDSVIVVVAGADGVAVIEFVESEVTCAHKHNANDLQRLMTCSDFDNFFFIDFTNNNLELI